MGCVRRLVFTVAILFCVGCAGCSYPQSPSSINSPVSWTTSRVSLEADDMWLDIDGVVYRGNVTPSFLHSDPGDATYCSLEITWLEHGQEMRLFLYFGSDRGAWWSPEVRTYNGKKSNDWLYYRGEFFRTPLGSTFTSSTLTLRPTSAAGSQAFLNFKNLRLRAFK